MLADPWGRRHCGVDRRRDSRRSRGLELPHSGLVHGYCATRRQDVRIGQPVVEAVDPVGKDVGAAQPLEPVLCRICGKDRADDIA